MSRDWLDKDFYATLGVSKDASDEDIKKAYKKLARENHPDLNPGDTEAEKKFKEISEASSVLGDERKRQEYDQVRAMGCLLYTSPSPRDVEESRMPSSA